MRPAIERIDGAKIVEAGTPQYMAHRHCGWADLADHGLRLGGQQFQDNFVPGKEGLDELFVSTAQQIRPVIVQPCQRSAQGIPESVAAILTLGRQQLGDQALAEVCAVHGHEEQARGHKELPQALPTRFRVDDEAAQFGPGDVVAFEAEQMQTAFCVELLAMEGLLDDAQVVVWILRCAVMRQQRGRTEQAFSLDGHERIGAFERDRLSRRWRGMRQTGKARLALSDDAGNSLWVLWQIHGVEEFGELHQCCRISRARWA